MGMLYSETERLKHIAVQSGYIHIVFAPCTLEWGGWCGRELTEVNGIHSPTYNPQPCAIVEFLVGC